MKTVVIQRVLARNVRSFIILPSGEGFTKLIFFNKNNRANFVVQKKKYNRALRAVYFLRIRVLVQESTGAFNPFWQTCSTFNFCILQYAFVT